MEWKKIEGYEKYEVSNTGLVKSLVKKQPVILIPQINKKNGYLCVDIYTNKKRKNSTIHRLVANAFIPNIDNKREVDHIDGNRQNNNVENLRWAHHYENARNCKLRSDNTSSVKGVSFNKRDKVWRAFISDDKRSYTLGSYKTIEEAIEIRQQAENDIYGVYMRT